MIGKSALEINIWTVAADRERFLSDLKRVGHVENMETTFRRKDGTHVVTLMSASLINLSNEPHILLITKDITDEYKLGQVFRNLLSNSIKFSPESGKIEILFEESTLHVEHELFPVLKVSIRDQGLGVPENELGSIFDKFNQSSRTKTGAGGTGLGLSISQEIVNAHHGKIWAENNPQGGATFCFVVLYEQNIT